MTCLSSVSVWSVEWPKQNQAAELSVGPGLAGVGTEEWVQEPEVQSAVWGKGKQQRWMCRERETRAVSLPTSPHLEWSGQSANAWEAEGKAGSLASL